jgi:Predicted glycosyltransferases
MSNKLISIIILSYKNLKYLKETIDSVLNQTYSDIEIIIGDDGTEKFNIEFYKEYIKNNSRNNIKNIIVYTNDINLGIVKNANKAANKSKGTYIKFIAADDVFYSNNIVSEMIHHMSENNLEVLTSNILFCNDNMNKLNDSDIRIQNYRNVLPLGKEPYKFFKLLCIRDVIGAPGVMFKRSLFSKYGYFDEEYKLIEDWPMWLKLSRSGHKIDYIDIISVKYRAGIGVSSATTYNQNFIEDLIKCYEKEILPYKKELGYWLHKKIKWQFIRKYKFVNYSLLKKSICILENIDIISRNQIKKRINKIKRILDNEKN